MWIGQSLFVLGVVALIWKASQPPDDNDKGGGKLQPAYVRK
jgi:hypothetical protein